MPRNKYPEETIQKILDVSFKLFLENGYEETTILDIVSHLGGLSRGAFYHHFKSKEEVLDALGNRLFFENNPFEKVKQETNLSGLEKLKKAIKLQYQSREQQELDFMVLPLMRNPKILVNYLQTNQKILCPFYEELFQEAINDGSIRDFKYPKALSGFFLLITNIWITPTIFPSAREELLERLYFTKELLDGMGVPLIDDEILHHAKAMIEKLEIE